MPAGDAERSWAYASASWGPSPGGFFPGTGTSGLETGGRASVSSGCGPHSRSQHVTHACYLWRSKTMLPLHGREVVEAAVLASEAHGPHAPGTCLKKRCGVWLG